MTSNYCLLWVSIHDFTQVEVPVATVPAKSPAQFFLIDPSWTTKLVWDIYVMPLGATVSQAGSDRFTTSVDGVLTSLLQRFWRGAAAVEPPRSGISGHPLMDYTSTYSWSEIWKSSPTHSPQDHKTMKDVNMCSVVLCIWVGVPWYKSGMVSHG